MKLPLPMSLVSTTISFLLVSSAATLAHGKVQHQPQLSLKERALYWLGPVEDAASSPKQRLRNPSVNGNSNLAPGPTDDNGPVAATTNGGGTAVVGGPANAGRGGVTRMEEEQGGVKYFDRISSFYVCTQLDKTCDTDKQTSAQFLDVSRDGNTVIYTDKEQQAIGFLDISNAKEPVGVGMLDVLPNSNANTVGVPTGVKVCGNYAIVTVRTSKSSQRDPSGFFHVIDMERQRIERSKVLLRGQPSSVDFTSDCRTAVITVENERNEKWNADESDSSEHVPAGFIMIVDTSSDNPIDWTMERLDITDLGNGLLYDSEPEPESVAINDNGIAAVTLQENNGIVLIDLKAREVINAHSAGTVALSNVDLKEDHVISLIDPNGESRMVPREPDGIDWIGNEYYATADDGDWNGGGRGFTLWSANDNSVVFSSGGLLDHQSVRVGHYPEQRSENSGTEPENLVYTTFGDGDELLFVNAARTGLAFVYDVKDKSSPVLRQVLPAGHEPQGGLSIPSRNLYLVASSFDDRKEDVRSTISIYERAYAKPSYPGIVSRDRQDGTPIPFGSLSALTTGACPLKASGLRGFACEEGSYLYSVEDSHYQRTRIFKIDPSQYPAVIVQDIPILDSNGVLAKALSNAPVLGGDVKVSDIINSDNTVNLDAEGVDASVVRGGGFWVVSEGDKDADDDDCLPNYLLYVSSGGVIEEVTFLPEALNYKQSKHGFEGVAEDYENNRVVVALQDAWEGEPHPRIGIYDLEDKSWTFFYYRLDSAESQDGGKVSIADISFVGDNKFLVLERDHKAGLDAAVKRIYQIDLRGSPRELTVLNKVFVFDVLGDLATATNGPVIKNVEGLTVDKLGDVWINTDNNGVDTNSGENLLLPVGVLYSS